MAESESAETIRSYKLYFDDFEVGRTLQMGTYMVTEEEILTSALQYDLQPLHIDAEAAKHSIYGGIISSGWMTCSIMTRLVVTGLLGKVVNMGSPGVNEIRQMKSAYPENALSISSTCMEVHPSQSKLDRSMAVNRWETRNQHGEFACTVTGTDLFGCRSGTWLHVIASQQGDSIDAHHRVT